MVNEKHEGDFYTVSDIAKFLGISRVAVFKRIKKGDIRAIRIGNIYAISKSEFASLIGTALTGQQKREIEQGVEKTVREYHETLQLLGNE